MLARIALVACAGLFAGSAEAVTLRWSAEMDQAQETTIVVPAPEAAGIGRGRIDTETGHVSWRVTYGGLTGPAQLMHFHGPGAPGVSAGITVDMGMIGGLDSGSTGMTMITPDQVSEFLQGLWYINVHTAANVAGEIRGQVYTAPIPLPAALPLMLAGLGAFGVLAAHRRRQG
jgi:hypothetical protein